MLNSRQALVKGTILLLVATSLVLPSPGQAAVHRVTYNGTFSPNVLRASAGDTVIFTLGGGHDIKAFAGGNFSSEGSQLVTTFQGGTAWYRCTPHSVLTASGNCIYMCGVITDRPTTPPAPPTIGGPFESVRNVAKVTGTAEVGTQVFIYDSAGGRLGSGITRDDSVWTVYVGAPAGDTVVTAKARYPGGTFSSSSSVAQISNTTPVDPWNQDAEQPVVGITSVHREGQDTVLKGVAYEGGYYWETRNTGVDLVRVQVHDKVSNTFETYVAPCPSCPNNNVSWTLRIPNMPLGSYYAYAEAVDRVGHNSFSTFFGSTVTGL